MSIAYYNIKSIDDVKAIYPNVHLKVAEVISDYLIKNDNIIIYINGLEWDGFDRYKEETPDFKYFERFNFVTRWIKYENVAKKLEEFLDIL